MIGVHTTWTTERIALLKNRIDAGFSCAQIAREIGVSRNAVVGKANRLGLFRFKSSIVGQVEQTNTRARPKIVTQYRILRALWAKPQVAFADVPSDSASRCSLTSNFSSGIAAGQ